MADITQQTNDILQTPLGYSPASNAGLAGKISQVVSNILGFMTLIAALAFIYYLFLGTINWILSGGDSSKAQTASAMVTNALVGIIITAAAYPIIYVLGQLLGVPFTSPADLISNLFT